jgi:hypothetical protein
MFARLLPLVLVGCAELEIAQSSEPIKLAVVKADAPDSVKSYYRRANEARPILARYFQKSIAQGRESLRTSSQRTAKEIRIQTWFIDQDVRKLEFVVNRLDPPLPIGRELFVGAIGTVKFASVNRVVDANRAMVEMGTTSETYTIDKITESSTNRYTVFLEMPTAELKNGQRLDLSTKFEVTGKEPYVFRPGFTQELFILKPIDVVPYLVDP